MDGNRLIQYTPPAQIPDRFPPYLSPVRRLFCACKNDGRERAARVRRFRIDGQHYFGVLLEELDEDELPLAPAPVAPVAPPDLVAGALTS